ncbi:putative integral membrane protein [Mycobacterium tuberculosis]|nr:putative integral membrane protein [Mycobacterium tuberculosis]
MHDTVAAPARPPAEAETPFPPSGGGDDDAGRPWWRRRAGLIVQCSLVAVALAAFPLYRDELPDVGAIWAAASHADPGWLTMVVLAVAGSMSAFARLQRRLLRVGGLRMTLRRAFAITYAGNALSTTLPAGPAVSVVYTFRQFRRGGASARLATAVILAGGVITTTAYSLVGLLALIADPHARGPALIALAVPLIIAVLLVPVLRRPRPRALVMAPLRRCHRSALAHPRIAPYAERLAGVRDVLRPTARDWAVLVALALLNWVFDILALLSAATAVGVEVSPNGVALAYFTAQAAGSLLPLLPGGLGAIEGSMAASLVAFGATLSPAAAAVGLYRLVSYWAVVAVGWLAWAALHERARLKSRAAAAGTLLMDGMTAFAFVIPYSTAPLNPQAKPNRP